MSNNDYLTNLMSLGFTEYEARVYLALLGENPATGYQLSKKAGVPRSMVYEALGRLEGRGAVLKTNDRRATLYRPVPPQVLMDRYKREQEDLIDSLRVDLMRLFNVRQEDYFWSIRGRTPVFSYAAEMIGEAKLELMLVISDRDLEQLRMSIEKAAGRGVAVQALLTGEGMLSVGQIARHPPLESELQEVTDLLVLVADRQQVLIANTDIETNATVTSNQNLVLIARQFVWMELFAQRIYATIGQELMARLSPYDRNILESYHAG